MVLWVFFFLLNWLFQHDCLDTYCFLSVLYACVFYFSICTCSAQLIMFHLEKRSRNTLIIIIIIIIFSIALSSQTNKQTNNWTFNSFLTLTGNIPGYDRNSALRSWFHVNVILNLKEMYIPFNSIPPNGHCASFSPRNVSTPGVQHSLPTYRFGWGFFCLFACLFVVVFLLLFLCFVFLCFVFFWLFFTAIVKGLIALNVACLKTIKARTFREVILPIP